MKNILHLGSSWSETNGMINHGLPFFVTQGLIKKNIDVNYYSSAIGGGGLGLQFEILLKILDSKEKFDLILIEVTTQDRFHCQLSDSKIIWERDDSHPKIKKCRQWIIDNYIFWMPIFKEGINHHWGYLPSKSTYLKIAKTINAGDFNWESVFLSRIIAIKRLLAKRNIPFLIYAHDSNQMIDQNNSPEIVIKEIYEELDFCINELMGKDLFKKYAIDHGYHMSPKGDEFIAEHLLVPRIIEKLK